MTATLQIIGAAAGLYGWVWQMWDTYANGPVGTIFFGLVALITGGALS